GFLLSAIAMAAPRRIVAGRDRRAVVEIVRRAEPTIARDRGPALLQCDEVAVRSAVIAGAVLRAPAVGIGLGATGLAQHPNSKQTGKRSDQYKSRPPAHE